jgi:hypothetical protein
LEEDLGGTRKKINAYKILERKPYRKRPIGSPTPVWDDDKSELIIRGWVGGEVFGRDLFVS